MSESIHSTESHADASRPDELSADDPHMRPEGVDDVTIEALGKLSEAMETMERARGALYEFHQLTGTSDLQVEQAAELFKQAGHNELADLIQKDLIGRNVIDGRWTFQIVENYEDDYAELFRHIERTARNRLVGGRRHIYESEMKERRRTKGRLHHEARPR